MQTRTKLFALIAGVLIAGRGIVVNAASLPRALSTFLTADSSITQITVDLKGNLYVLGYEKESPIPSHGIDLFIAKLDPNATRVLYFVYLGGTSTDVGDALAVDASGNVYIAGTTNSADFPTLPKITIPSSSPPGAALPFAVKLDPTGTLLCSVLFVGSAVAVPSAMVVDPAGEAIITGYSSDKSFPATGSFGSSTSGPLPFTVKLAADGLKSMFALSGVGGTSIGLDPQNNIYVSGTTMSSAYPTTPGAFQTTFMPSSVCPIPPCQMEFPAGEQYVTKIAPDGTKLLYSTFLTGSSGSTNNSLAVDSAGEAFVTGTTASADYPYTTTPAAGRKDTFVSKLDSTGSKVLLSVQQGGSGVTIDAQGNIVIAGIFGMIAPEQQPGQGTANPPPPDPGETPNQCVANGSTILSSAYVIRLSGQDGSVLSSSIIGGTEFSSLTLALGAQGLLYIAGNTAMPDVPLTRGVLYSPAVTERTTSGIFLAAFDPSLPPTTSQVSCAVDPASTALVGPVAPGQLLTLFGTNIGPAQPLSGLSTSAGAVPVSLGGVKITFDGAGAPLLYVSANQINLQVPFEVMHNSSTLMQVEFNGAVVASRLFAVTPRNPSLFVMPGNQIQQCAHTGSTTLFSAVATLADGSPASCSSPAAPGSSIVLFVNGIGVDALNQVTGNITASSPAQLGVPFSVTTASGSLEAESLTDMPNAISGLGQLSLRIPNPAPKDVELAVRINGEDASPFTFSRLDQLAQILAVLWITP